MGYCAYYLIDDVCVSTDSLTCNTPAGINDFHDNKSISVYPNPFTGELTVYSLQFPVKASMYDIFGKEVLSQTLTTVNSKLKAVNLHKGIFLLEITTDKERMIRKVVKE